MAEPDAEATLFVGVGMMGAPMARCYASSGRHIAIFDADVDAARTLATELGSEVVESLDQVCAESGRAVSTVILMLPNSRIVESVLGADHPSGLLNRLPRGALIIDMGSSEPSSTRRLAEAAGERGIDYVDAPVSGGVVKAATGELAVMMGGTPSALRRARPHVEPLAGKVIEVGRSGAGHCAKALNNWLSAANVAACSEVLAVATQAGIDPQVMIATLNASTGRSQASEFKFPNFILTGSYDSNFAFDLMRKDLGIGSRLAEELGSYTPVLATVLNAVEDTSELLSSNALDHTEIARFYECKNDISFSKRR